MIAVDLCAVNELLLTDIFQLALLEKVASFDQTCGCKGPIGTANVLILNVRDSSFRNPVDRFERHLRVEALSAEFPHLVVVTLKELALGCRPVGESVVAHP